MRFAEKNHKLVYAFLQERRYDPGEYYDLAVMGYLRAVERYCHPCLSAPLFVLHRRLPRDAAKHCVVEARREPAQAGGGSLLCALRPQREPSAMRSLRKHISSRSCKNVERRSRLHLPCCGCMGYSIVEIAARYKLDPRRVRRLLKSLYSAHLRFRMGTGRRRKNEGSTHKDAPRAAAPAI